MGRHIVVGKGPVGSTLAEELQARGHQVLVLSRSGGNGPHHRQVDASDAAALCAAVRGAEAVYNCVNPPYHRWPQEWPPVAQALLTAAASSSAVLVTMSNLYGYGPVDGPITEDLPLAATGTKGQVRARMWEQSLARHEAGDVRVVEARASDFVGPRVTDGGHLGARVVPRLLAGRPVKVLGDPDQPHSWTDVRDVAHALATMGTDARTWGRAWHVPTAPPVTQRQAIAALCAAADRPTVDVGALPGWAMRVAGLALPVVRELQETRYQFERPFVLDSSAWTRTFGDQPTPLKQTWADTIAWWRAQTTAAA